LNFLQRVLWLARKNFFRGSLWNIAAIFLTAISCLVLFSFFLFRIQPNQLLISKHAGMLWMPELLLTVIIVLNFVSMLAIFNLITRVRYHEIGLLRAIGSRKTFVFFLLLFETFFIVAAGFLVSVLFAFLVHQIDSTLITKLFQITPGFKGVLNIIASGLLAMFATAIIAMLAASYPAFSICRIEPYNAIRNRE